MSEKEYKRIAYSFETGSEALLAVRLESRSGSLGKCLGMRLNGLSARPQMTNKEVINNNRKCIWCLDGHVDEVK